jgi:hypothetical protein
MNKPNHPAVMATDAVETWLAGARRDIPMGPRRPFQRSPRCGAKGWRPGATIRAGPLLPSAVQ